MSAPTNSTPRQVTTTATLFAWSAYGHTPKTKREGAYCDELARLTVEVSSPAEAIERLGRLLVETPDAHYGHAQLLDWPNQNERSHWLHKGDVVRR